MPPFSPSRIDHENSGNFKTRIFWRDGVFPIIIVLALDRFKFYYFIALDYFFLVLTWLAYSSKSEYLGVASNARAPWLLTLFSILIYFRYKWIYRQSLLICIYLYLLYFSRRIGKCVKRLSENAIYFWCIDYYVNGAILWKKDADVHRILLTPLYNQVH